MDKNHTHTHVPDASTGYYDELDSLFQEKPVITFCKFPSLTIQFSVELFYSTLSSLNKTRYQKKTN
ncbi:3123_t:CDS:2, partial [Racocetra persica]